VESQISLPVVFKGVKFRGRYRFLTKALLHCVEKTVVGEKSKAVEEIAKYSLGVQTLTYLTAWRSDLD